MTWDDAYEMFDDMLDDTMEEATIAGLSFRPSRVLRECDPIAYRVYMLDWLDSEGIDSDELEGIDRH